MTNETQTTQHTPAPWGWYDAWEDGEGIHSPRLGRVEAGDRQTIIESRGEDLVVSEPDARLIAAAPDLLAALETVSYVLKDLAGDHTLVVGSSVWGLINDSIAKARGS